MLPTFSGFDSVPEHASVNQRFPSGPATISNGTLDDVGTGNSVTTPQMSVLKVTVVCAFGGAVAPLSESGVMPAVRCTTVLALGIVAATSVAGGTSANASGDAEG